MERIKGKFKAQLGPSPWKALGASLRCLGFVLQTLGTIRDITKESDISGCALEKMKWNGEYPVETPVRRTGVKRTLQWLK